MPQGSIKVETIGKNNSPEIIVTTKALIGLEKQTPFRCPDHFCPDQQIIFEPKNVLAALCTNRNDGINTLKFKLNIPDEYQYAKNLYEVIMKKHFFTTKFGLACVYGYIKIQKKSSINSAADKLLSNIKDLLINQRTSFCFCHASSIAGLNHYNLLSQYFKAYLNNKRRKNYTLINDVWTKLQTYIRWHSESLFRDFQQKVIEYTGSHYASPADPYLNSAILDPRHYM